MAAYKRFASTRDDPDQLYRDHYGASLVGLVFRFVDWYLGGRQLKAAGPFPFMTLTGRDQNQLIRRHRFPTNTGQLS